jgi:hypothetical protein
VIRIQFSLRQNADGTNLKKYIDAAANARFSCKISPKSVNYGLFNLEAEISIANGVHKKKQLIRNTEI